MKATTEAERALLRAFRRWVKNREPMSFEAKFDGGGDARGNQPATWHNTAAIRKILEI